MNTKVRLLEDCCHGVAGQIVTVSASRARDLIEAQPKRRAESCEPKPAGVYRGIVGETNDGITVRLNHGGPGRFGNPGDTITLPPEVSRELIASGFAEEVS